MCHFLGVLVPIGTRDFENWKKPFYLKESNIVPRVAGLQSVRIVPCGFCPAARLAVKWIYVHFSKQESWTQIHSHFPVSLLITSIYYLISIHLSDISFDNFSWHFSVRLIVNECSFIMLLNSTNPTRHFINMLTLILKHKRYKCLKSAKVIRMDNKEFSKNLEKQTRKFRIMSST